MMDDENAHSLDPFSIRGEKGGIGIYEVIGVDGEVLYVGKGNLRINLKQHLPSGWFPINEGRYYRRRMIPENMSMEDYINGLISEYERECGKLPKYNRDCEKEIEDISEDLSGLL